ncbi:MAG: dihydropteroate synthase, partial [Firmicutes bacterium]|nr:dihydropteroate synthase [Bacillota bacterium]
LPPLRLGSRDFAFGSRTYLMGVLNVTPDSFSDGGLFFDPGEAVDQALRMIAEGADIIDVGGESARPGSVEIGEEEELRRIRPVLERLLRECGAPVSVDTYKASVARAALEMGAHMINDIGGLRADPAMPGVLASYGAPAVIMHNKREAIYRDVMGEVISFLRKGIDLAVEAGLPRERIVVDPGFGFGKTPAHNLTVLRRLREIRSLGVPVMIGTSRKSTIGKVLGLPVEERLEGTAATVALAVAAGADFIRVHDVREMARVARMADAVVRDADRAAGPGGITGRAPGALGHPEPGAEPGVEPGADGGRRLDGNRLDGGWVEDRVNGRLDGREGGS